MTTRLGFALFVCCGLFANNSYADVLLEKINSPGFVLPSYAITKRCTLSDNGILGKIYQVNGLSSEQSNVVKLSVTAIKNKIASAQKGVIKKEIFPVDANSITYHAYQKQADGSRKIILLYEENGGSGQEQTNTSESAVTLRNFIDLHCTN